jgi:peptidoglycan/xylan/chitin deacetylase (PgdA/CDA1 family)
MQVLRDPASRFQTESTMIDYETIRQNQALWDLFTRKGEYTPEKLDRFERCIPSDSSERDIFEPGVSKFLIENGFEVEYPDNKQFAVCLTHDVDEIYPPLKHCLYASLYSLKTFDFTKLRSFLFWKYQENHHSPYKNFQEIIRLEERYQAKSSFYFLTTNEDIRRYRYDIEELDTELGMIIDHGFEVGLHGGYYAFDDYNQIKLEKEKLEKITNRKIVGYRNHFLRFKVPDTWELLAALKMQYDTTYGYPDTVGFRNGMCHPFKPFNLLSNKEINIVEIPLIIMDLALFKISSSPDRLWNITKELIDTTKLHNGVLTILWHNDSLSFCPFKRDFLKIYEKILWYCDREGALMTSAEEICKIFS